MKRPIFFGLIGLTLLWQGCSNEIEVIGDWKEIPIIYGLVNMGDDSVTYIRVEKAYLPPNKSAYEVAQIADSLYYNPNDIDVLLYENEVIVDTMERVDLTTLGIVKDPGIFASNVNYAYRTHHDFGKMVNTEYIYKVEVHNRVTGNNFSASTKAINSDNQFLITTPATSLPIDWVTYNDVLQRYEFKVLTANWRKPADADIYDMRLMFRYAEYQVDLTQAGEPEIAGTRECKTLEWRHTSNYSTLNDEADDDIVRRDMDGEKFFEYLSQKLSSVEGTNIRRCATKIDIIVDAAGTDFAEYIQAQTANEDLVGGLYPVDPYTNVENGFGIFSTRLRREKLNYNIDQDNAEYISVFLPTLGFKNTTCTCQ